MRTILNYVVDEVRKPAAAPEINGGRLERMTFSMQTVHNRAEQSLVRSGPVIHVHNAIKYPFTHRMGKQMTLLHEFQFPLKGLIFRPPLPD
jgi:hypothetical protein